MKALILIFVFFIVNTTVFPQDCKYKLSYTVKTSLYVFPKYYFNKSMFRITKDTLTLYTNTGKSDFISHGYKTDDILQEKFIYKGFLKKINTHLIEVKNYESTTYILFSHQKAEKVNLWNFPVFNKQFTKIATFSGNLDYDAIPNGIQIFNIFKGKINKKCELLFSDFEIENLTWIDNNNIHIKIARNKDNLIMSHNKNYLISIDSKF